MPSRAKRLFVTLVLLALVFLMAAIQAKDSRRRRGCDGVETREDQTIEVNLDGVTLGEFAQGIIAEGDARPCTWTTNSP